MRIVQCHGCFDVVHIGHVRHLKAAARLGDYLVVTITSDRWVRKEKGAGRPIFPQELRKEMLWALRCVNAVHIIDAPGWQEAVELVRPALYVKGQEYRGRLPEQPWLEAHGIAVAFTDEIEFHSTNLIPLVRVCRNVGEGDYGIE